MDPSEEMIQESGHGERMVIDPVERDVLTEKLAKSATDKLDDISAK